MITFGQNGISVNFTPLQYFNTNYLPVLIFSMMMVLKLKNCKILILSGASYSLYLLHWPIYKLFIEMHNELSITIKIVVTFICILIAILIYEFFEKPIYRMIKEK